MDFLGIGPLELMLILILALVVFGPGKLPEIGAKLGGSLREMRKATREFSREIDETRQAIEGPINEMKDPMQELAEPFQEAGTAIAGARDVLSNPSKAIEGYVMGQYASADKPAKTAADEPPPVYPAEPTDAPTDVAVASDSTAAEVESVTPAEVPADVMASPVAVETEAVAAEAVAAEAVAESDAVAAEMVAAETVTVESEPAAADLAIGTDASAVEPEPMEPVALQTPWEETAVSPDARVVSAIASMESAFPNATPISSEKLESAGDMALAHKLPEAAAATAGAAAFEVAAQESLAAKPTEPMAAAIAPDADPALPDAITAAPEPPQMPAPSLTVEPTGQTAAEVPPPQPVAARARHRAAPRKSASPGLQSPPGDSEAPSSATPASQD
ncbi:MAG: twin-arginine translocase TatA/TatE family subunit [Anaerolineae bacterium]|nr:twin-arginine translocase TatA/TatE family subunit [Anaerolineae bacterium]